jgi:hypothetical protein
MMMDGGCRLRCTVSGGLEGVAENEVRQLLGPDVQIRWPQHVGTLGSQLEIVSNHRAVAVPVMQLRLVEYVYLQLHSTEIEFSAQDPKALLQCIQDAAASVPREALDSAIDTWQECRKVLRNRDVGLEGLPGELLPTPEISLEYDDSFENASVDRSFVVNTIYTKPQVAKAVVHSFLELVRTRSPELSKGDILWLDAGAGSGALLQHLPPGSIGVDTHPGGKGIHQMDFLKSTKETLHTLTEMPSTSENLCIISNPPFSERSRGDYSAIVKFINHAVELSANFMGVIVPVKFARKRVWQSLGMNPRARLLARFTLPTNSFYDPSSSSSRHIQSVFLFFGIGEDSSDVCARGARTNEESCDDYLPPTIHVVAKRNKGSFPFLTTAEITESVVIGLGASGVELRSEADSNITLSTRLSAADTTTARMELYIVLNKKRPLSLTNCISGQISGHSLGWMSSSVKPPVAWSMCSLAMADAKSLETITRNPIKSSRQHPCSLVINTMCGEGTIELESRDDRLPHPFFMIAGDKSESAANATAARLACLDDGKRPLVDIVIWDAQRLPVRTGVADLVLADLPIAGGTKKAHQEPSVTGEAMDSGLDYKRVMTQTVRVLACTGKAALLSIDQKALSFAAGKFNGCWFVFWSNNLNLGGLTGKLLLMERKTQCSKDLSVWVDAATINLSPLLAILAIDACASFSLNDMLEIEESSQVSEDTSARRRPSVVSHAELRDSFFHSGKQLTSHLYRIWFDPLMSSVQTKLLEKIIRANIEANPPEGMISLR